jgi:hypothetical protein
MGNNLSIKSDCAGTLYPKFINYLVIQIVIIIRIISIISMISIVCKEIVEIEK